jgi:hypothetical protein
MRSNENLQVLRPCGGPSVLPALEAAARAALQVRLGRSLTDADWAAASHDLLQFARMMRAWALPASCPESADRSSEQLKAA